MPHLISLILQNTNPGWHRYMRFNTVLRILEEMLTQDITFYKYKMIYIPKEGTSELRGLGVPAEEYKSLKYLAPLRD